MIYLFYGILILVAFILQGFVISYGFFSGILPDLLLVIITIMAVNRGKTLGGTLGFVLGFLQDLFSGGLFGVNAITKMIVGYLCGFLRNKIYEKNFIVSPLIAFVATIINQLLIIFFIDYLLLENSVEYILKAIVIPLACYNALLAVPISVTINKIDLYLSRRKLN